MSGYPEKNYPAFHAEAKRLRALGYEVSSPAEVAEVSMGWLDAMRLDIVALVGCDAIATLPGWQDSKGASIEVNLFLGLGLPVLVSSEITE